MRLQELFESSNEDRAIISLSASVYDLVKQYSRIDPDRLTPLGKIGDLFDTPIGILNNVEIRLLGGYKFEDYVDSISPLPPNSENDGVTYGVWDAELEAITLNTDLIATKEMRIIISHELRHALDDYKSDFKAGVSDAYARPTKKVHRKETTPDDIKYEAQPAEINARFVEVLDKMTVVIPNIYRRFSPDEIKSKILISFNSALKELRIANLFPEKTESTDYKRLVKRGMDFIQKEMMHVESELEKAGTPKKATGNW